jgi:hypothetical protein
VTDEGARVLRRDGTPVGNIYACGNDMRSIMGGNYPGPGITTGPAFVFAYLAARDITRRLHRADIREQDAALIPS